jgi:hypothetical protein
LFKEYYDSRFVKLFDPEAVAQTACVLKPFEEVLTEEGMQLPKKLSHLNQDIAVLEAIVKKEIMTSSFDFDGRKYSRKEAATVLAQLEAERDVAQKELDALDQNLYRYFYAIAPLADAEGLKGTYQNYFDRRKESDDFLEKVNSMMALVGPVFRGEAMELEAINAMIAELKENHEIVFKTELKKWLTAGAFDTDATVKAAVEKFISTQYQYFSGDSFFDNELIELSNLAEDSWKCVSDYVFSLFKNITETQAVIQQRKKEGVLEA